MLLLLSLKLYQDLQRITQLVLAYYVQEPNEACVGDDGPPRQVHVDIKDIYGRP